MNSRGFKLGWDKNKSRIIHIDEVPEGFVGAICPDCKSPLIASNRNPDTRVKATYFKHHGDSTCSGETLIHLWAKQVIADKLRINNATYTAVGLAKDIMRKEHRIELTNSPKTVSLEQVSLETRIVKNYKSRIPDISARLKTGESLYVEIFVNNAVDKDRSNFFRNNNLNCLEIDLSSLPDEYLETPLLFEDYVIRGAPRKWVSCYLFYDLDIKAQSQADSLARKASSEVNKRRFDKRTAKKQWREEHRDFVALMNAYMQPENQQKAEYYYEDQLATPGTSSFELKQFLEAEFRKIPEVINISVNGELGFHCHRIVWQWKIYQRLVIDGFNHTSKAVSTSKTDWVNRGYEESAKMLAWYDHAPKWGAQDLYEEVLTSGVRVRPICLRSEEIAGEVLSTEREKPESLSFVTVKEWRSLPKPVCVIRRYLKELVSLGVIDTLGSQYFVQHGVTPPLCHST